MFGLLCFANILGVLYWLLRGDEFNSCIFILHSFDRWSNSETQDTFSDLASTCTVADTHQGTQFAWMPHSTQFCYQKIFFMEWTANYQGP